MLDPLLPLTDVLPFLGLSLILMNSKEGLPQRSSFLIFQSECTSIRFAFLVLISVIFIFQILHWVFHFYQIILISVISYFMNVIISLICLKWWTVILRHFLLPEKTSVFFFPQLHFSLCLFGFLSSVLELFFRCLLILHNLLMIKKRELKSDLGALCAQ